MWCLDVVCKKMKWRADEWSLKNDAAKKTTSTSTTATPKKEVIAVREVKRQVERAMPLPVTEDTPPDMLSGAMDIRVLLPNGRTVGMSVERSTPMMDLLVAVSTAHKLSPAAHALTAVGERGAALHHLPSTPVGALDTRLIHLAARNNATLKRAPQRPAAHQPFQTTFRLQVHLPRNQLFVTRVGPETKLGDVLQRACAEKNLDPSKYEMRHPANLQEKLSLSHSLGEYRLQEVTMVACRPPGAPLTPADIMALHREEGVRRQQVKATGNTAYPTAFAKRPSAVHQSTGSVSSDSLNGRSISPAPSDESRSVSPPAPEPPKRPGRKRRPAPKPPGGAAHDAPPNNNVTKDEVTTFHSRTSSDSSGYHEASVLSESTDTRTNGDSSSAGDTLPRRSKLPAATAAAKGKASTLPHGVGVGVSLSRSLSNLTAPGVQSAAPAGLASAHSASTTSLASQGGQRKKKAAPPPPSAPARRPVQLQPSVHAIAEISEAPPSPARVAVEEAPRPTPAAAVKQPVQPVTVPVRQPLLPAVQVIDDAPVRVPVKEATYETPVRVAIKEMTNETPNVTVTVKESPAPAPTRKGPPTVVDLNVDAATATTGGRKTSPPTVVSIQRVVVEATVHEDAVVPAVAAPRFYDSLEPPSLAVAAARPVPSPPTAPAPDADEPAAWAPTPPPGDDALLASELSSDWQYTLPAPPTAFRDLSSPSTTEFGTVALADAQAFLDADLDEPDRSLDSLDVADPPALTAAILSAPAKSRVDVVLAAAAATPSEPLTATLASHEAVEATQKRPSRAEDSWAPQQLATLPAETMLTSTRTVSGDVRVRPDGVTREVFKVNPLFDAGPRRPVAVAGVAAPAKYAPDEQELLARSRTLVSRSASSADLAAAGSASSLLKNFTISSYEKPKLVDSIFAGDAAAFKKPAPPAAKPALLRTNSAVGDVGARPAGAVKRATSYLSLARPYARPTPFQSIARAQSISSLVLAEEAAAAAGELRKAASEVDVSRGADDDDVSLQTPLQSVQLLRTILGMSQGAVDRAGRDDNDDRLTTTSRPQNTQPAKPATPPPTPTPTPTSVSQSPAPAAAPTPETPDAGKAGTYVYRGPPAINFGSWSERPKVQVSLKSDKDYRIGGTVPTFRRVVEDKLLQPHRAGAVVAESRIEPKPLTMRIVSQSYEPAAPTRPPSHAADADAEAAAAAARLPIVRGVELKKPAAPEQLVQLRNTSSTRLNGEPVGGNAYPLHRHSVDVAALARTTEPPKRYTSVVGVNGGGGARPTSVATAFGGAKPMPTVKGFRDVVAAAVVAQPLKTINGAEHNVRAASGWPQRPAIAVKTTTPTLGETPSVVKFRRPTPRPAETRFTNPRDALMDAIKKFGGQDALKEKHAASG